ncbi:type IV secretory system conjugative DNA transfer family protein [Sinorhizobium fredii]|uniref:type IV secretory system conjugative DNA transfer family protein n=1 Tax=Rhizobium fredii TaxID=380 RepID=UPI0035125E7E
MKKAEAVVGSGFIAAASGVVWNAAYAGIYDLRRIAQYGLAATRDSMFGKMGDTPWAPILDAWQNWPSFSNLLSQGTQNFFVTTAAGATLATGAAAAIGAIALLQKKTEDLHGSAKLLEKSALKEKGLRAKGGLLLGRSGNTLIRDEDQSHVIVIGPPASGKTECFVIPNLIEWEGTFIALDFKGTLYERTAKVRRAKGDKVYLFGPGFENSHTYNPLDMIRSGIARITDIQALANLLMPVLDPKNAHWNNSAQMLVAGMISYVLESKECENARTMGTIVRLFSVRDDFIETLKFMRDEEGISDYTRARLTEFMAVPSEEAGSIRSTLNTHLKPWQNPAVEALTMSGENAINIESLRRDRSAVYLVIDTGQIEIFAPLLKLFLEQVNSFVNRAYRQPDENKILFMIDEFYQLGRINSIIKQLPFARDRDIRICLVSQGIAQVDEQFTRAGRESILASCVLQLFCSFNDEPTVDLVMKKTGPTTQQYETTSRQLEPFVGVPKRTVTQHTMAKPLFRANELYAWNRNHLLILKGNAAPFICDKILADRTKTYIRTATDAANVLLKIPPLQALPPFIPSWAKLAVPKKTKAKETAPEAETSPLELTPSNSAPSASEYAAFLDAGAADSVNYDDLLGQLDALVGEADSFQAAIEASDLLEDKNYTLSLMQELREEHDAIVDLVRSTNSDLTKEGIHG